MNKTNKPTPSFFLSNQVFSWCVYCLLSFSFVFSPLSSCSSYLVHKERKKKKERKKNQKKGNKSMGFQDNLFPFSFSLFFPLFYSIFNSDFIYFPFILFHFLFPILIPFPFLPFLTFLSSFVLQWVCVNVEL